MQLTVWNSILLTEALRIVDPNSARPANMALDADERTAFDCAKLASKIRSNKIREPLTDNMALHSQLDDLPMQAAPALRRADEKEPGRSNIWRYIAGGLFVIIIIAGVGAFFISMVREVQKRRS